VIKWGRSRMHRTPCLRKIERTWQRAFLSNLQATSSKITLGSRGNLSSTIDSASPTLSARNMRRNPRVMTRGRTTLKTPCVKPHLIEKALLQASPSPSTCAAWQSVPLKATRRLSASESLTLGRTRKRPGNDSKLTSGSSMLAAAAPYLARRHAL